MNDFDWIDEEHLKSHVLKHIINGGKEKNYWKKEIVNLDSKINDFNSNINKVLIKDYHCKSIDNIYKANKKVLYLTDNNKISINYSTTNKDYELRTCTGNYKKILSSYISEFTELTDFLMLIDKIRTLNNSFVLKGIDLYAKGEEQSFLNWLWYKAYYNLSQNNKQINAISMQSTMLKLFLKRKKDKNNNIIYKILYNYLEHEKIHLTEKEQNELRNIERITKKIYKIKDEEIQISFEVLNGILSFCSELVDIDKKIIDKTNEYYKFLKLLNSY